MKRPFYYSQSRTISSFSLPSLRVAAQTQDQHPDLTCEHFPRELQLEVQHYMHLQKKNMRHYWKLSY